MSGSSGITSYGAYIPMARLPLKALGGGRAVEGGPEKAVAAYDEDAVTMAVAAARDCLGGFDREQVDALFFASTSYPYKEKQAATLVARALGLRRDVATADHAGSLRAGTGALASALDAVAAGSARNALVVASDCRMGAPRSGVERSTGDAAAAVLVGADRVAVRVEGRRAVADEMLDLWRSDGDPFVHTWEDRFVTAHGYRDNLVEAVKGLMAEAGQPPAEFRRAVLYAPDARSHAGAARACGLAPEQLQDPLLGTVGNAGAAAVLLQLAAALESVRPGEKLLLASYGDGADALALETTEHLEKLAPRRGVAWHRARRRLLRDYDAYLRGRNLAPVEWERGGAPGISATVHWRERDMDIGFEGQRCRECGTEQFPLQRVCYRCGALDAFERIRLADRPGRILSYTFDYFFPTPEPPAIGTMTEVEGGARVYIQMADASPDELRCDLPVEFVFRKIHDVGNKPNYFWKCTPIRDEGGPGDAQ